MLDFILKKQFWVIVIVQHHSTALEKESCRFDEAVAMQQSLLCAR